MQIWVDGSAHPNPGPGGYGIIVVDKDKNFCNNKYKLLKIYSKQFRKTTNNEQELKALVHAFLIAYQNPNNNYVIYSDSNYAINVFERWAKSWERHNWIKSDNKPIQNLTLIKAGYSIYKKLNNCKIIKVKGHSGEICNELVDALATNDKKKIKKYLDSFDNGNDERWQKYIHGGN